MTAGTGVDVKICGIRTPDDYDACHAAGAAFVGMVFFPRSPRHLSMGEARTLADHADRAGGGPSRVALTVDMDDVGLEDVVATARPHLIQLHGNETPERAAAIRERFGLPLIRAIAWPDPRISRGAPNGTASPTGCCSTPRASPAGFPAAPAMSLTGPFLPATPAPRAGCWRADCRSKILGKL